ncbi:hypothetical protein SK128_021308, partial [Halocaridina rubra]
VPFTGPEGLRQNGGAKNVPDPTEMRLLETSWNGAMRQYVLKYDSWEPPEWSQAQY